MVEQEEAWTVVTASDKKRVMRKRGKARKRPPACATTIHPSQEDNTDRLRRSLEDCIEYLTRKTVFWKELVRALSGGEQQPNSRGDDGVFPVEQMICYGIGNFSQKGSSTYYAAPLWQLACAVALQRHFAVSRTYYYDPASSAWEIKFVGAELKFQWLETNDRGNHPVRDGASTLFFMPHCPAQLYENVVWSNYPNNSNKSHQSIWILGNSLSRVAETNSNECPCLRVLADASSEWQQQQTVQPTKKDCDEAPGNLYGAFNDTCLSRLPSRDWPAPRPYDRLMPHKENGELL